MLVGMPCLTTSTWTAWGLVWDVPVCRSLSRGVILRRHGSSMTSWRWSVPSWWVGGAGNVSHHGGWGWACVEFTIFSSRCSSVTSDQ